MSNRSPELDRWLADYTNPQSELVAGIRAFIMDLSPELTEAIKWQTPTFIYKGNIASFFPRATKNVTLMFHQGASIDDPLGLLEGDGDVSRVARFLDYADFAAKKPALEAVILGWIQDHS